jgi:hypothetical protein
MKWLEKTLAVVSYGFVLVIHGGCGMTMEKGQEPQSTVASNPALIGLGDINLAVGGARTKNLNEDQRYRPVKIVFVDGMMEPSPISHRDLCYDEFTVGIESHAGQQVVALVQKERPWEWVGLEAIPFSNHLVFSGNIREMQWQYSSVFPDERLASFMQELRVTLLSSSKSASIGRER